MAFQDAFQDIKKFIAPIVPANKDVEMGLVYLIRRRKNYRTGGELELTPPAERPYNPGEAQAPPKKKRGKGTSPPRRKSSTRSG